MLNLKLNLKNTGIDQKAIMKYKEKVEQIHHELHKLCWLARTANQL